MSEQRKMKNYEELKYSDDFMFRGGTIMRSIIQDGSDDWPPNGCEGAFP